MAEQIQIQWREKAEPAAIGICRARPASEWHDYAKMKPSDAQTFLDNVNALKPGRTMFEYRAKGSNATEYL